MPSAADGRFMDMALALARRRVGLVGARPAVGAVIARNGRVLGRGATGPDGRPHAETGALDMAAERYGAEAVRGATAYVSLEPCAHHGRTPPCADALIAAGIARVVAPLEDIDPRVSGRGFARLREAGVAVETGLRETAAREVNRGFFSRIGRGRPWVTLKLATTLDGRIATATGESRWITGPEARRRVHLMRLRADAVLVGIGTARADDPMLNVRGFGENAVQPVRVIADTDLRIAPGSRLTTSAGAQPLWLLHGPGAGAEPRANLEQAGAVLFETPLRKGRLNPAAALWALAAAGINTLLCEGGATLAAGLLAEDLVDEIALFTAGAVIGGDGIAAVGALALGTLAEAPRFHLVAEERVGNDVLTVWRTIGEDGNPS